ncbi:MAG: hypothetical protein FJZ95_05170 [Chloroflexi bacterium]|nr:hypothetical protein [Chloroflexota bacterium]
MAKVVAKLFKRPEDANKAMSDLKAKGFKAEIVDDIHKVTHALADTGLPEQAMDYYKLGLTVGGKIVKVTADDAKVKEVNTLLLMTGHDRLIERPAQYATSPGFPRAERMSATNPIDAQMSGDFRKY